MIVSQEGCRHGQRGYCDGLNAGAVIGLPPVMNFGSEELRNRIVPEVLSGKKFICLAISEAFAGSDVQGLVTFAKKTEDGKHWIINGTKKWITNGMSVLGALFSLISFTNTYAYVLGSVTTSLWVAEQTTVSPLFLSNVARELKPNPSKLPTHPPPEPLTSPSITLKFLSKTLWVQKVAVSSSC